MSTPTRVIGRHPDCDIVVNDPTVSRRHVEVSEIGADLYLLVDQGSTSGTFRMEGGAWKRCASVRLKATDRVRLGAYESTLGDLLRKGQSHSSATPKQASPPPSSPRIERDPLTGQIVVRNR